MTAQRWRCCDEWCTLIRSAPSAVSPAPRRAAPHCGMARTRRPLVVYVEDEPAVQRLVEFWLEDAGFGVVVAGDGTAGLAAVREHLPDLVVTDALLPGVRSEERSVGIECVRTRRSRWWPSQ